MATERWPIIFSKLALAVCLLATLLIPEMLMLWAFLAVIPLAIIIDDFLKGRM